MPYLGQAVIFIPRPGSARAGQTEMAAIVTRVLSDGHVCLRAIPDDPSCDMWARDRVRPQSPDAMFDCWRPTDGETSALRQEIEMLRAELAAMRAASGAIEVAKMQSDAPAADDAERDRLRTDAESLGSTIDRRWGIDRLKREIDDHLQKSDAA